MNVFLKPSSRGENDAANKSREEILASLWTREQLDEQETFLQEELRRSLHLIAPGEYTKVELIRKGGRGYNYDFDAVYTGELTLSKKIEFKYGCSSLDKLPQFLSLCRSSNFFLNSYPFGGTDWRITWHVMRVSRVVSRPWKSTHREW